MNISVGELMSDQVIAVRSAAAFAEIVAVMRGCRIASVPVIDDHERVIGIVSEDDLLAKEAGASPRRGLSRWRPSGWRRRRADRRRRAGVTAAELMTSPAVTVTASTPAHEAAAVMRRRHVHQLPVVDPADGRLRGIITRSDLLGVYERPDDDIRREVEKDVLGTVFGVRPGRCTVTVSRGTVTVGGVVERRSSITPIAEAIEKVDGVVAVRNHLEYQWDDTIATPQAYL